MSAVKVSGVAERIAFLLERLLGAPSPLRIRAWDGSETGPDDAPVLIIRARRAIRRLLWQPNEIGLARAWVAGEIDLEGDLEGALTRLESIGRDLASSRRLSALERAEVYRAAVLLGAVGPAPKAPPEEADLGGDRHSKPRDRDAIRHHYDVGNDFYELVLGPSMVYSCAYWTRPDDPAYTLDDAQRDKLELICRKLGLQPGMRLLDVGCGWGSLVVHAAREHGVRAVGITLSEEQAEYARKAVVRAGVSDQVDIRVQDWRDLDDDPFDAIASIGMAEHLGSERWAEYAGRLHDLLAPGGRLLNHQIVRRPGAARAARTFIDAYVFPDGELLPLASVVAALEDADLEVRDVENLREHYARTLRSWVANLEGGWHRAKELAGAGRARVWRLYMTGSALSFDAGRIGVTQVLAVRRHADGRSDFPLTRTSWLGAL
ncbi:MAG TPA: cyclopropane-fatty-acyl-phospholipid synthase family protein [Jiangellaceae bacterium]|nr:cyclopropane-fatty-acyl-phospholipid synthase family protein [Jiangellaceae bacterium]